MVKYTVKVLPKQSFLSQNNDLKQNQIEARRKQISLKIWIYPSSFLGDSNYGLTLTVHVFPVLVQMYNAGLINNYTLLLSGHKISYWDIFDKIIKSTDSIQCGYSS